MLIQTVKSEAPNDGRLCLANALAVLVYLVLFPKTLVLIASSKNFAEALVVPKNDT